MLRKFRTVMIALLTAAICLTQIPFAQTNTQAASPAVTNKSAVQKKTAEQTFTYVNPLYRDVLSEADIEARVKRNELTKNWNRLYGSEPQYYSTVASAGKSMRKGLANRDETVTVCFKSNTYPDGDLHNDIMEAAFKHTGVPKEGDSLRWVVGGYRVGRSYYEDNGVYYITYNYYMYYYTTSAQEKRLDSAVNSLLSQLNLSGKTDYQKVCAIYDYMCDNITYDYEHLNDNDYELQYTAYAALIDKTAVCQGYAVLFYRLALESGVENRVVTSIRHAWNMAKLGARYYFLDATWDAGTWSYQYFLKGKDNFCTETDHIIEDSSDILNYNYNISATDYDPDTSIDNPDPVGGLKVTARTKDAIRLNWNRNAKAVGYIVEQKKSGKWTRIKRIGSNSTTTCRIAGLNPGTSYQFRVKAFAHDGDYSLYSTYKTITGKTNPAPVTGLKVAGTAKTALRLSWNKNSKAEGYIVEQYKGKTWKRIAKLAKNTTTSYRITGLSAGKTYKFRVKAYAFDKKTAIYGGYASVSGKTDADTTAKTPTAVTGLKIGGRAADAIRLNWNKNSGASGYIIEQYKSGQWKRIARIGSNSTVTYRVEKLAAGTKYSFRIKSYSFKNSKAVYSTYKKISGYTKPAAVSGLKVAGRSKDALRISWNKNSKANGYIVEQYKNGKWVRISRIGKNSTVTCRVSGLKSSTSYVFRVRTFIVDGKTPLYGSSEYVTGTTR